MARKLVIDNNKAFLRLEEAGILSIFITSFSKWHAESKIAEKVRETHVA